MLEFDSCNTISSQCKCSQSRCNNISLILAFVYGTYLVLVLAQPPSPVPTLIISQSPSPPSSPEQPTAAKLRSLGVKPRDFAFESKLPPVPKVQKLRKSKGRVQPQPLKPIKDMTPHELKMWRISLKLLCPKNKKAKDSQGDGNICANTRTGVNGSSSSYHVIKGTMGWSPQRERGPLDLLHPNIN